MGVFGVKHLQSLHLGTLQELFRSSPCQTPVYPLNKFLGCDFMSRQLQPIIKSEKYLTNLDIIPDGCFIARLP